MESGGRSSPPALQQQQQTGLSPGVLHQQLPTTGRDTAAAGSAPTSGVRPPPFSAAVAALQQQQQRAAAATAGSLPMHLLRLQQQHTLKQQQAAAAAAFAALQQQEHSGNATGGGGTPSSSSLEQQQALLAALQQQQCLQEQQQQQALAAVAALPQSSPSSPQTHPVPPEKVFWVQCDRCDKWRVAPYQINATTWVCEQNTWDPRYASCSAVEEADPTVAAALAAGGEGSGTNHGGSGNGTTSGNSDSGPHQRLLKQAVASASLQQQHGKTSSGKGRNAPVTGSSAPSGAGGGGGIADAGAGLLSGRSSKGKIGPVSVELAGSAPPTKKVRGKTVGSNSATSDSSSPLSSVAENTSASALMAAAAAGIPFSAVSLQHAEGVGASTLGGGGSTTSHHPLLPQQVLLKAGTAATAAGEQQHSLLQQQLLPHMQQQNLPGTAAAVAAAAAAALQQRAVSAAVAAAAGLPTPSLLQQPHLLQLQLQQQLQQPQLLLEHWVQCDACNKWRRAPMQITTDKWYCRMNTWAPHLASCDAPEEPDVAGAEHVLSEAAAGAKEGSGAGRQQREATGKRQRGPASSGARGKGKGRGKTPGARGGAAGFVPPLKGRHQEALPHHTPQAHRQQGDNTAGEDGSTLLGSRSTSSPIGGRIAAAGDSPSTVTPPLHPLLLQQRQQPQQQQLGGAVSLTPPVLKAGDTTTRSNSVGLLQKQSSSDAASVLQGCSAAAAAQFAAALAAQQHQLLQAAAARLSGSAAAGSSAALPAATAAVTTPPASLSSLITASASRPAVSAVGSTVSSTAEAKAGEAGGKRGQMRWACCTSCGKWRRVPEDAVFKGGRFCCYMNVWNPSLCSCATPQEPFEALQPAATTPPKQQLEETSATPHPQQHETAMEIPALSAGSGRSCNKGLAFATGREEEKRKEAATATLTTGSVAAASTGASLLLGMLSQPASLHQQQRLQQLLSQQQQEQQGGPFSPSITEEGSSRILNTIAGGRPLSDPSDAISADGGTKSAFTSKGLSAASSLEEPQNQSVLVHADEATVESSVGSACASGTLDSSRLGSNGDAGEEFWPKETGTQGVSLAGEATPAAGAGSTTEERGEAEEKEEQQKAPAPDTSGRCAPASRLSPGDEDDPDHSGGNSSSNTSNTSSADSSSSTSSSENTGGSSNSSSQSRGGGRVGACEDELNGEKSEVFATPERFLRYSWQQLRPLVDVSYYVAATGTREGKPADYPATQLPHATNRPHAESGPQKNHANGGVARTDLESLNNCSKSGGRCRAEVPLLEEAEHKYGGRKASKWFARLNRCAASETDFPRA